MKVLEERLTTQQLQHTTTCCGLRKKETVTRRNSKQEYARAKERKQIVNTRRIKHEKDNLFCLLTNGLSTKKNVCLVTVSLDTDRGLLLYSAAHSLVHAFGLQ